MHAKFIVAVFHIVLVSSLLQTALTYVYNDFSGFGDGINGDVGGEGGGGESYYSDGHSIDAAIHSKRTVSVVPVHEHYEQPKINSVSVDAAETPLVLTLKSKSSPLIVKAVHESSEHGSIKKTKSVDPPHIRVHETLKPVLQEYREIVRPHRKITQLVHPMLQKISTFVSAHGDNGGGGGSGNGQGGYEYYRPGHSGGHGSYDANLDFGHGLEYSVGDYGGKSSGNGEVGSVDAGSNLVGSIGGELLGGYSRNVQKVLYRNGSKRAKRVKFY